MRWNQCAQRQSGLRPMRERKMKIAIEVSKAELEEMMSTPEEFKRDFLAQLNDGVIGDEGSTGEDWLVGFTLEVTVV